MIGPIALPGPLQIPEKLLARLTEELRGVGTRTEQLGDQIGAAAESWREMARVATEALPRLERLEQRAESITKIIDQIGPALEAINRMEALAQDAIPIAERGITVIERLIATIDAASEQVEPLISTIDTARDRVDPLIKSVDGAREKVDPLIEVLESSLPALERALSLAAPLEGSVERLGRALDRLPGGRGTKRAQAAAAGDPAAPKKAPAKPKKAPAKPKKAPAKPKKAPAGS